ncbi:MAG: two-component regulator propeller domain-containing protein [Verrucomicrobiota bacterium]
MKSPRSVSGPLIGLLLGLLPLEGGAESESIRVLPFLQDEAVQFTRDDGLPSLNVTAIHLVESQRVQVETDQGSALFDSQSERWKPAPSLPGRSLEPSSETGEIRQTAERNGERVLGCERGLFRTSENGLRKIPVRDRFGRLWGEDVRAVAFDSTGRLALATRAGVVREQAKEGPWECFTGREGLPFNDFTCMAAGPDGVLWFGTTRGAIRLENGRWHYRQGPRWLPHDEVRGLVVDDEGSAWVATAGGVALLKRRRLTLSEKARIFEMEAERMKRTPYGYLSPVRLKEPGNRDQLLMQDNDNDGLWTAMYGAGQCFGWAATGDAAMKARAERAFGALVFLQEVVQQGEIKAPAGYVARSIRSTELADPNEGRVERDREMRRTRDRLWKVIDPRWPRTDDGKWYWKTDTSSDELDGHYFFYGRYFDLVAEGEEKERVRKVVRALTDHLIDHDFVLMDHDGRPTRWGMFRPSVLNQDADWKTERGLNSLSLLSYLITAHHVTGEIRYLQEFERLVTDHHYLQNALHPKEQRGPGSGNQSDDEMAFMAFYNLMAYVEDDAVRKQLLNAFFGYWLLEEPEMNPFFNFAYAAFGQGEKFRDVWGEHDLSPTGNWLEDSISTLKAIPLDRISWPHANSHRIDLQLLPSVQSRGFHPETEGVKRGFQLSGKVLPADERPFNHWNTDPWTLDYGGDGRTLGCGTVYLLPYYMGLYHGMLERDED